MNERRRLLQIALILITWCSALSATAQGKKTSIPDSEIAALEAKLGEQAKGSSTARRKLGIRRVIREGESLLKAHPTASNRYLVLGILFQAQRSLLSLDKSTTNRRALLETSRSAQ